MLMKRQTWLDLSDKHLKNKNQLFVRNSVEMTLCDICLFTCSVYKVWILIQQLIFCTSARLMSGRPWNTWWTKMLPGCLYVTRDEAPPLIARFWREVGGGTGPKPNEPANCHDAWRKLCDADAGALITKSSFMVLWNRVLCRLHIPNAATALC